MKPRYDIVSDATNTFSLGATDGEPDVRLTGGGAVGATALNGACRIAEAKRARVIHLNDAAVRVPPDRSLARAV
jgi:hypothetical protein